jgi:hypothetical protein
MLGGRPDFDEVRIMMTDTAYIAAYRGLIDQYFNNQASMEEHLVAVQALKDQYRVDRGNVELPVVP